MTDKTQTPETIPAPAETKNSKFQVFKQKAFYVGGAVGAATAAVAIGLLSAKKNKTQDTPDFDYDPAPSEDLAV